MKNKAVSKKNRKKSNNYYIPIIVFILCSVLFLLLSNPEYKIIERDDNKKISKKDIPIESIIEFENENNELIKKTEFNEVGYYLYKVDNDYKSFFIKNNKLVDLYSIIKSGKREEYDNKINELLEKKYPKFLVDSIKNKSTKNYEVNDNEMIIHYSDIDLELEDKNIFLKVNYNEIKDYMNIMIKIDSEYTNEDGYNYDPNKKTIAFSYDDGPNGELTLNLVNILAENKAHATFFMVGNRMNYFATTVTAVHNSGNEIGSHTYSHYNMATAKPNKIVEKEALTNQTYFDLTGDTFKLLRPPYGSINAKARESLDVVYIDWSLDTEDWKYRDVEHVKNTILDNVEDGDIVLMHDLYETSVEATREVLPILYSRGYQVVTVSELAKLKGQNLENGNLYRKITSQ